MWPTAVLANALVRSATVCTAVIHGGSGGGEGGEGGEGGDGGEAGEGRDGSGGGENGDDGECRNGCERREFDNGMAGVGGEAGDGVEFNNGEELQGGEDGDINGSDGGKGGENGDLNGNAGSEAGEGGGGGYDGIWQQLVELNASGGRLPLVTAPNNLTRSLISASKELRRAAHEVVHGMRRRSGGEALPPDKAVPHEKAMRMPHGAAGTQCICATCGRRLDWSIMLSRAHAFEGGLTAMWGASAFTRHPVGELILLAEELRCEYELKSIVIPFCDRDHVDQALRGSAARAEAAALSMWRNELDLDMTAAAARCRL